VTDPNASIVKLVFQDIYQTLKENIVNQLNQIAAAQKDSKKIFGVVFHAQQDLCQWLISLCVFQQTTAS
jgi:hypothetical protein